MKSKHESIVASLVDNMGHSMEAREETVPLVYMAAGPVGAKEDGTLCQKAGEGLGFLLNVVVVVLLIVGGFSLYREVGDDCFACDIVVSVLMGTMALGFVVALFGGILQGVCGDSKFVKDNFPIIVVGCIVTTILFGLALGAEFADCHQCRIALIVIGWTGAVFFCVAPFLFVLNATR